MLLRFAQPDKQTGFTLIELVATIILIGVLSVTVLPKFSDRSGAAEYALRDQLVSLTQHAQQRAMFDHSGACYSFAIQSASAEVQRNGSPLIADSDPNDYLVRIRFDGDYEGLTTTAVTLYFDDLGNLLTGGTDCASSSIPANFLSVPILGGNPVSLHIYPTGYVQRQG